MSPKNEVTTKNSTKKMTLKQLIALLRQMDQTATVESATIEMDGGRRVSVGNGEGL